MALDSRATIPAMSDHHVQIWMLIVQAFALLGLGWYSWETRRMRKASQEQVCVSQNLIAAAMDQVEGLSKPCLTLDDRPRDGASTILAAGREIGSTVARSDQGFFVLRNIGSGPALSVQYEFIPVESSEPKRQMQYKRRYLQSLLVGQTMTMVEAMSQYNTDFWVHFHYESVGGRKYRTKLKMIGSEHVLTAFEFKQV